MKSISLTVFTIKLMQSMTIFITGLITSSDEEFASRYAKYSDEIDALEAQAIALEAKAGGTKIQTY